MRISILLSEKVEDNTSYMVDFKQITDEEYGVIDSVWAVIYKNMAKACTACRYCTRGCPRNISITDYFALYISMLLISCANYYFVSSIAVYAKLIS
jgi:predicted aldo/keto reductase-like oxidoreductase